MSDTNSAFNQIPDDAALREALGLGGNTAEPPTHEPVEELNPWIDDARKKAYVPEDDDAGRIPALDERQKILFKSPQAMAMGTFLGYRPTPIYTPLEQIDDEVREYNAHPIKRLFEGDASGIAAAPESTSNEHQTKLQIKRAGILSSAQAPTKEMKSELIGSVVTSMRRENLVAFVKARVAAGESVESLVSFAAESDPDTASRIREIGSQL
jgi:hypothetical protein